MTPQIVSALQRGLDAANAHRPTVEFIRRLAEVDPRYKEVADPLVSQLDHLQQVCESGMGLCEQLAPR